MTNTYTLHVAVGIHMWAGRLGRLGYKATTLKAFAFNVTNPGDNLLNVKLTLSDNLSTGL